MRFPIGLGLRTPADFYGMNFQSLIEAEEERDPKIVKLELYAGAGV
jgi:hypothetical protein